jgi:hypothetical protein
MSILLGYDYFDTTAEYLDILKRKLTVVEKAQQGNTAEVVKHANDIVRLNSLGKNSVQYDFKQTPGYPPGFLQTPTITDTDMKNAKFMVFSVSGNEINYSSSSPLYGFYETSRGTTVIFTVDQRSKIIRTSFSFIVTSTNIQIRGVEFKNIDSAGNVTNRTEATTVNCFLLTT